MKNGSCYNINKFNLLLLCEFIILILINTSCGTKKYSTRIYLDPKDFVQSMAPEALVSL